MTGAKDRSEYPPLLPAGFHDISDGDLEKLFVVPFNPPDRRQYLVDRLRSFIRRIQTVGLRCEMWVNGSFATRKLNPDDIDLAIVASAREVDQLPEEAKSELDVLLGQRDDTRLRYGLEVYFVVREDIHHQSYWRGWFGFSRDEEPKGIPRLEVA